MIIVRSKSGNQILEFWCWARVQKSGYGTHDLMHRLAVDNWPPSDSVLSKWCEKSGVRWVENKTWEKYKGNVGWIDERIGENVSKGWD